LRDFPCGFSDQAYRFSVGQTRRIRVFPKWKGGVMNKKELKALNADLIQLLQSVRDQIDDTLDELAAVDDDDANEMLAGSDSDDDNGCD